MSTTVSPRVRRLAADREAVRTRFSGSEYVKVTPGSGNPPDTYEVEYNLKGLVRDGDAAKIGHSHFAVVRLGADYPRAAPFVEAKSSIFHPNVAGHFCIGDVWTPAQSIADVIEKVGDMIQWRVYNVQSALNADAALYATQNSEVFPIGDVALTPPESEITIKVADSEESNEPAS